MTPPVKPDLSKTQITDAVIAKMEEREAKTPRSRHIEDFLAIVGIAQAIVYGVAESLASVGWRLGACTAETGIPWVTLVIFIGCVLPKTVGRASAGKVWEFVGAKIGSKG